MRRIRWGSLAVTLMLVTAGGTLIPSTAAQATGETQMSYILVPHPDDEFQAWSLIENAPSNYKVFVVATRGEATQFCDPTIYPLGYQPGYGEVASAPSPTGKWTPSCVTARQNSMVGYLTQMSAADPTIPGSFGPMTTYGPFPGGTTAICRTVAGTPTCGAAERTVDVWVDSLGRGAIVNFNLGDGDLTSPEATWALNTVINNRAALGINSTLPNYNALGAFSNTAYSCFSYAHPDHKAVHTALWNNSFGLVYRAAATCASDPDQSRAQTVTPSSVTAAFQLSGSGPTATRIGAHVKRYGWLAYDYYPIDTSGQNQLFQSHQNFWVKY